MFHRTIVLPGVKRDDAKDCQTAPAGSIAQDFAVLGRRIDSVRPDAIELSVNGDA
jgi:hypothetical protein